MANVVVSALATWNGKALKKAQQDVNVFEKRIKSFARTFGYAFSATAVVAFSKKAVKAFAEDEAAAKSLQLQLENTGNAFRVTEVEQYIKSLEKTYAVLSDLRGPFQTFLNLTKSVELSQRTLEAALDISAGTGQSLDTVVGALAAGIRGQTRALAGLNTGLDAGIIKSGDMNKIMAELEKKFSGQASARLDTYAGKMDALKKGSDEATKAIGEGLVDALTILSKDQSIDNLANSFENLGNNIAFTITQMAKLIDKFNSFTSSPSFKPALLLAGAGLSIGTGNPAPFLAAFGYVGASAIGGALTRDYSNKPTSNFTYGAGNPRADLIVSKNLTKARKEEYKIISKKNEIENKNLEELKKKFDLERIGLTKALNEATDAEIKTRLQAQLAILDEDEARAKKLLAELEAYEALKKLADGANKAAEALNRLGTWDPAKFRMGENKDLGLDAMQILAAMMAMQGAASGLVPLAGMGGKAKQAADTLAYGQKYTDLNEVLTGGSIFDPSFARRGESRDLTITIDTSQTNDRFAALIAESLQIAEKTGISYGIAGGL